MSIQNVSSSTAAITAQLLQQQESGGSPDFSGQSLPQLSSDQVQSLQQSLQNDLQQSLSGSSGGSVQSQLDSSVSNTLSQAGFSKNQVDSFLDKLNKGFSGAQGGKRSHGGHHARQAINGLIQALQSNTSGQPASSAASTGNSSGAATGLTSSSSGQSLDVTA